MEPWKRLLREKKILIADGGWGTELQKRGLAPGEPPEAWNLSRPEEVRRVALSYVEAGADIILTNTFGGSLLKLTKVGLGEKAVEVNRKGATLSREAAGDRSLVFASIGPSGEFVAPLGTISEADMIQGFAEQARALAAGGADGIVVETMMDLAEARAALRAAKESTALPVVVTMTFDKGPKGYATLMGIRPEQAAAELARAGADMVGANCGTGIEAMIELIGRMRSATSLPIWCKPNAGLPELIEGKTVYRETPEMMASKLGSLVQAGANIVGGCCGTTPSHIRAFVAERKKLAGMA
jgi:5-methyltetrahydrofolate--homocysteine methyltransferase